MVFPKVVWDYLTEIKAIIALHTIGHFKDLKELKRFLKDDEIDKIYIAL
jgi:dTDP-4-amino-4,6-dideoxygalactose transaminase